MPKSNMTNLKHSFWFANGGVTVILLHIIMAQLVKILSEAGALEYRIIVAATASDPAPNATTS